MDQWLNEFHTGVNSKDSKILAGLFFNNQQALQILGQEKIQKIQEIILSRTELDRYSKFLGSYFTLLNSPSLNTILETLSCFNYCFDAFMIPLAKQIYSVLVGYCLKNFKNDYEGIGKIVIQVDNLRNKMLDRQPFPQTKRLGFLFLLNLSFKCYFKLDMLQQLEKILNFTFLNVFPDGGEEEFFPMSEKVEFLFWYGKFLLLRHEVFKSKQILERAYINCHTSSFKNKRLILIYLTCANLVCGHLLKRNSTGNYPLFDKFNIQSYFSNLMDYVRFGCVRSFIDEIKGNPFFIKFHVRNILLWRCELLIYRNLFKKVLFFESSFLANSKAPPYISFRNLWIALNFVGSDLVLEDSDSVTEGQDLSELHWEMDYISVASLCSRLIQSGLLRGNLMYYSKCVVVSRKEAFPDVRVVLKSLMESEVWWEAKAEGRKIIEDD